MSTEETNFSEHGNTLGPPARYKYPAYESPIHNTVGRVASSNHQAQRLYTYAHSSSYLQDYLLLAVAFCIAMKHEDQSGVDLFWPNMLPFCVCSQHPGDKCLLILAI